MLDLIPRNNSLVGIYASGESPNDSNKYRKPSPEMVNHACNDLKIKNLIQYLLEIESLIFKQLQELIYI